MIEENKNIQNFFTPVKKDMKGGTSPLLNHSPPSSKTNPIKNSKKAKVLVESPNASISTTAQGTLTSSNSAIKSKKSKTPGKIEGSSPDSLTKEVRESEPAISARMSSSKRLLKQIDKNVVKSKLINGRLDSISSMNEEVIKVSVQDQEAELFK